MFSRRVSLVLGLVLAWFVVAAAPGYAIAPGTDVESANIMDKVLYLKDPSAQLTLRELSRPAAQRTFRPLDGEAFVADTRGAKHWFKFTIEADFGRSFNGALYFPDSRVRRAVLYEQLFAGNADALIYDPEQKLDASLRTQRGVAFPIALERGQKRDFYLSLSGDALSGDVQIWETTALMAHLENDASQGQLLLAVLAGLLVLSIAVFLLRQDAKLLWIVGASSMLLLNHLLDGPLQNLVSAQAISPGVQLTIFALASACLIELGVLFSGLLGILATRQWLLRALQVAILSTGIAAFISPQNAQFAFAIFAISAVGLLAIAPLLPRKEGLHTPAFIRFALGYMAVLALGGVVGLMLVSSALVTLLPTALQTVPSNILSLGVAGLLGLVSLYWATAPKGFTKLYPSRYGQGGESRRAEDVLALADAEPASAPTPLQPTPLPKADEVIEVESADDPIEAEADTVDSQEEAEALREQLEQSARRLGPTPDPVPAHTGVEDALDPATGILASATVLSVLEKMLEEVKAGSPPASAILLQLDEYERLRAQLGNATADRAIKLVAVTFMRDLRDNDSLGRSVADALLAVLPECDAQMAETIAFRTTAQLRERALPTRQGMRQLKVKASVTSIDVADASAEDILKRLVRDMPETPPADAHFSTVAAAQ